MQEPLNDQKPPQTRGDRKAKKHQAAINGFNLKDKSQIRTGLVLERRCTDCFCLVLFLASICTMVGLTGYSLKQGQVEKLIGPIDGDFKICGADAGYQDYKYLYLSNLDTTAAQSAATLFSFGVCVKQCPKDGV